VGPQLIIVLVAEYCPTCRAQTIIKFEQVRTERRRV